jgi:adenine-specific DNA-methyltransferase
MHTLTAADPETRSADIVGDNLLRLRELFPEAFAEGRVDFDVLRQLLGNAVDDREEKYGLNWHGKRRARQLALTPSTGTLRPCPEESLDWENTRNLMVEGDNLEVLKLLQKSYAGKVKLIYIDPPYNTGNDFVYQDDFRDNIRNYLEVTGQLDEAHRPISSNTAASGRFHTDWLNMIYPRLKLAKSLLCHDGAILVSINDNEAAKLRTVMDELFGEENFVGQIVWQRSKKGDAKLIATVHEYVLCYVRNKDAVLASGIWRRKKEGVDGVLAQYESFKAQFGGDHGRIREAMLNWYRALDDSDPRKAHRHYNWSDDRGLYFAADFAGPDDGRPNRPRHDILHPVTGKPCKKPSTGWRWDEAKTRWALEQMPPRIHFGPDETTIPNRKSYLEEIDSEPFSSVFYRDGRSATLEVERLIGAGWFPFPKNTEVLADFVELTTDPHDIVLDFFAGSGSTGHAVWKLNVAHRSERRFILVQLPEPTEKERFRTIADITKERLRRAAAELAAEHTDFDGDLGFRVFKLDSSNIRPWEPDPEDIEHTLESSVEHLKAGRTGQDVLYELLLKLGLDLAVPIETREIAGKALHSVGAGTLLVCLADGVARDEAEALALGIAAWHGELAPEGDSHAVFRDSAFADDVAKTNLTAILHQHGIEHVRSI